jgi:two-component system chemotaxis sensor kinase CheA
VPSDQNQDASLLLEYLAECDELLQRLDQDLVALESAPADAAILNRVFRAFHTIKGTSGFMGFAQVVELTHHAEDVLNLLRKGERKVTQHTMNVLLGVLDQLRRMHRDLRNNNLQAYDLSGLLGQLRRILETHDQARPMLGDILVQQNVISLEEQAAALDEAVRTGRKLGEVLVDKKWVSRAQVQEALAHQGNAGRPDSAAPPGAAEGQASASRSASAADASAQTIRVGVDKLDALINLVGELVLERNRLLQLSRDFAHRRCAAERFEAALTQSTARLSFITEELQSAGLRTRMVPIDVTLRRFPRLVRDLAASLGREVDLVIRGEETELDKTVVEEISDPLVHLVRNALDHGIEVPEQRAKLGKPRRGRITIEAQQEGDHILVRVADDGAGIDPQRVAQIAVEKGLLPAERARSLSYREMLDLIFLPGFSTATKVSDVSGRGVGMDVVRTNLDRLNGVIQLASEPGRGTEVTLKLPLTLAILPALLVRVAQETYALPLRSVMEAVRVPAADIHRIEGTEILRLRDRILPLQRLRQVFRVADSDSSAAGAAQALLCIVVIGVGEKRIGLVVDELLGQEETVIKPLGSYLRQVPGLAGATISGDGRVRLILDPAGIADTLEEVHA